MTAAERLTDFASETRRDRQTTPSPAQNKAGGTKSFRSNSNRGGGDRKPTLRPVRRAVQTGTSPRRTDRGRHRGAAGASCATTRTNTGTARRKQLLNALATFTDKALPTSRLSTKPLQVARTNRTRTRTTWVQFPNGATRCPIRWQQRRLCHLGRVRLPRL
ncbi:UNVERIFIED_CONTAM: hypothetical protein Sradi_7228800 [Sesamum radiatum]|uniref:Uncharacterized protein n=1 Tax=Sesamum radiatum TaxID=300843 RepID=A0AAW2IN82_SESRA